jgi:GNAT superfamily N-acetyltransferase
MWYPEVDAVMAAEKSKLQFKISDEEDQLYIRALDGKKDAGEILIAEEYIQEQEDDGSCYPFDAYEDPKIWKKVCNNEMVINIQHLEVQPAYRGKGIATALMKLAMKEIKSRFSGYPIYINASPMGAETGLSFEPLVDFYKKFGFKVLKKYPEHRNALLWRDAA